MAFNRGEPPDSEGEKVVKISFSKSHSILFPIKILFIDLLLTQIINQAYQILKTHPNILFPCCLNQFTKIYFLLFERTLL